MASERGPTVNDDEMASKIAEWHDAPEGSPIAALALHEHLGMTWEEYRQWAEG